MKYTDHEFNKHEDRYSNKLNYLKESVTFAENESNYRIDGTLYPTSTIWRDVAKTALELADLADWFDRYYENDAKETREFYERRNRNNEANQQEIN